MDDAKKEAEQLEELEALKAENERLKAKNTKLYKDCVSFAKKIKAGEDNDLRIKELENEIESLKAQLSGNPHAEELPVEEYVPPVADNASTDEEAPFADLYAGLTAPLPQTDEPVEFTPEPAEPQETTIPKNHQVEKKSSGLRVFFRTILWIFFIISLLISIGSGVTYLFTTSFANYTVAGYRFASVTNNNLSPAVGTDSVVLVKYSGFDGIEIGSLVVTTKDGRSIGKLTGLNVSDASDGSTMASISDNDGTYNIDEDQFVGTVQFKIPFLGKVVQYASANPYNYLTYVASATLILLALLILFPAKKTKNPKFGKDYTVEDFTI